MKNYSWCIALILILLSFKSISQCGNIDFETGTFQGWQGTIGTCCPVDLTNSGITSGRHTIMSGAGTDPNTCGAVPVVSPNGGNFSARLGNSNVGAEAEGLSFDLYVDPANPLLIYEYAVVFEDPGHEDWEQPNFQTRVILESGDTILCTEYRVTASSNLPGFQTCPGIDSQGNAINITYRNWTSVGVDLSMYAGTTVHLEFATGDCALGGHFGYAYLDGIACLPLELQTSYCIDDDLAYITAPEGFAYYSWSNGDVGRTIVVDPQQYQYISCQLVSYSGCIAELVTEIVPTIVNASFTYEDACVGEVISFQSTLSIENGVIADVLWNFGDGQYSTTFNPLHTYANPGSYFVSLSVNTENGCSTAVSHQVVIYPRPTSSFQIVDTEGCAPFTAYFVNTSAGASDYYWDFGDGTFSDAQTPSHTYTVPGTYQVSLHTINPNGCEAVQDAHAVITVHSTPVAAFTIDPEETDELQPEINFTNLSSGGSLYVWNFGDGQYSNSASPTHNYDYAGNYNITLQAANEFGCIDYAYGKVIVKPVFTFYVPNAFTPNRTDAYNQFFQGSGTHYKKVRMLIYDRWGVKIFEQESTDPPVWDGTLNGVECQIDVYNYLIYVTDNRNFIHELRGSVCLVR